MIDSIDFQLVSAEFAHNPLVAISINGIQLLDMVCALELARVAEPKGCGYGHIPIWWFYHHRILEKSPRGHGRQLWAATLFCECGELSCNDFSARITFGRTQVIWKDFRSWFGTRHKYKYPELGTFVFESAHYFGQLKRAYDQIRDGGYKLG